MNKHPVEVVGFGREICGDLAQAERREWWLSNGLGGYAAGTVAGTLTRRYHGLLIAPVHPPLGRVLVMAKADATLFDGERQIELSTNRWRGGAIDPHGHCNIESFRLDGRMPVWRFAVGDLLVEQRIWMEHGANTTYVAFRCVSGLKPGRTTRLACCVCWSMRGIITAAVAPATSHPISSRFRPNCGSLSRAHSPCTCAQHAARSRHGMTGTRTSICRSNANAGCPTQIRTCASARQRSIWPAATGPALRRVSIRALRSTSKRRCGDSSRARPVCCGG